MLFNILNASLKLQYIIYCNYIIDLPKYRQLNVINKCVFSKLYNLFLTIIA